MGKLLGEMVSWRNIFVWQNPSESTAIAAKRFYFCKLLQKQIAPPHPLVKWWVPNEV